MLMDDNSVGHSQEVYGCSKGRGLGTRLFYRVEFKVDVLTPIYYKKKPVARITR